MTQSFNQPALRPYLPSDLAAVTDVFQASIEELAADDYSDGQRQAWAEKAEQSTFSAELAGGLTLLATLDGAIAGFCSLKGTEDVAFLYVHPSAAGKGVGSALCEALEKIAAARGAKRLTSDVSDNAIDFFSRRGFKPERRNTVPAGEEWLTTTTMVKTLAAASGKARS